MASSAAGDSFTGRASRNPKQRALPERPLLTTPRHLHVHAFLEAERARAEQQPLLGLGGLLFVVPLAALLGFGVGGAERLLLVLAPIVLSAMPVVIMVAFWWEDWPGSSLRPAWSGVVDTLLVAAAAVALTALGQTIASSFDWRGLFEPQAGLAHSPTFPATLPIAGAAFVVMIELTLVSEGWPFRQLGSLVGGLAAFVLSWGLALAGYYAAQGWISGGRLGAMLVLIGLWQVWLFVVWRGWPISAISKRWPRLALGNALVVGGGIAAYAVGRALGAEPNALNAGASSLITAGLLLAMLFEGWLRAERPEWERLLLSGGILAAGAGIYFGLRTYADHLQWGGAQPSQWISHVTLALAVGVILHVAVSRRWPFTPTDPSV